MILFKAFSISSDIAMIFGSVFVTIISKHSRNIFKLHKANELKEMIILYKHMETPNTISLFWFIKDGFILFIISSIRSEWMITSLKLFSFSVSSFIFLITLIIVLNPNKAPFLLGIGFSNNNNLPKWFIICLHFFFSLLVICLYNISSNFSEPSFLFSSFLFIENNKN